MFTYTIEHQFDMKKYMKEHKVSLRDVAKYTRFEFTYLSKLNTGRYKTDLQTFNDIKNAVYMASLKKKNY